MLALVGLAIVLWVTGSNPRVSIPGPVSYTHLRAHETVLDLVCRLLLEKKKHTKTPATPRNHTQAEPYQLVQFTHDRIEITNKNNI